MADKETVVEAVGTAAGVMGQGKTTLSRELEAAMVGAVERAMAEGVSLNDSETILKYKQEAREAVLAKYAAVTTVAAIVTE